MNTFLRQFFASVSLDASGSSERVLILPRGIGIIVCLMLMHCTSGVGPSQTPLLPKGHFVATASMSVGRTGHSSTRLKNGKVLIVGGWYSGPLNTCELFDPATETFTPTGLLNVPRYNHTAVLLQNGNVLIVGGNTPNFPSGTFSSEIYDPNTGTFSLTGDMTGHYHPEEPKGVLLPSGQVLLLLGNSSGEANLFDPSTGTFHLTASLIHARSSYSVTMLTNGKVLIAGGAYQWRTPTPTLLSAELFDPVTGSFAETGSLGEMRFDPSTTILPNGKVLLFGGSYLSTSGAEIYDQVSGTFLTITSGNVELNIVRASCTVLSSGKVLLAGGKNSSGSDLGSAIIFDPSLGSFSVTGAMINSRSGHPATLLENGKVLITGGVPGMRPAELFSEQ